MSAFRDTIVMHVGMPDKDGGLPFWVEVSSPVALEIADKLRRLGASWLALIVYDEKGSGKVEWEWKRGRRRWS